MSVSDSVLFNIETKSYHCMYSIVLYVKSLSALDVPLILSV